MKEREDKMMNRKAYVVDRRRARQFPVNPKGVHILFQDPTFRYDDNLPFPGWHETIVIGVHDIAKPVSGYIHFNSDMSVQIATFLLGNEGRPMLVSCDAGLSRSVAVGAILRDRFSYDVDFVCAGSDQFRNVLIYTGLMREFRSREGGVW
jgi:hypothetical protein